jgi:hypothetical protein
MGGKRYTAHCIIVRLRLLEAPKSVREITKSAQRGNGATRSGHIGVTRQCNSDHWGVDSGGA